MPDIAGRTPAQLLVQEMGLNEDNIARRKRIVGLDAHDLVRIASLKELIGSQLDQLTAVFFDHLATLDEGRPVTANRSALERARQLKREHLQAMV